APFGWQPTWTDAQTGAARIVDAYLTLTNQICQHPDDISSVEWFKVTTEPQYMKDMNWDLDYSLRGYYATGDVIAEWRTVSEEQTADNGRQEITITQCEDGSAMTGFTADGQVRPPDPTNPVPERNVQVYTVQFVDYVGDWRVADLRREGQC
ncbi:MAG: hypothetical protein LBH76_00650, partial [Propionibacteriaceae bacterium]|nr:hypothetical protein [Propionibacteriaceae bacterium]